MVFIFEKLLIFIFFLFCRRLLQHLTTSHAGKVHTDSSNDLHFEQATTSDQKEPTSVGARLYLLNRLQLFTGATLAAVDHLQLLEHLSPPPPPPRKFLIPSLAHSGAVDHQTLGELIIIFKHKLYLKLKLQKLSSLSATRPLLLLLLLLLCAHLSGHLQSELCPLGGRLSVHLSPSGGICGYFYQLDQL